VSYSDLLSNYQIPALIPLISEQFRTLKLVFVLPQAWFSLGECIWWDKFQIKDKVAINTQYGSLRHFFVDFLGVNIPDLGMLVAELKEVATSSRSVQRAKTLIWQINSMDPAAEDLTSIYESAIFPVKIGNEDARLASRETEFAIVDCEKLASVFMKPNSMGVLAVLDFSNIDEIRKLRPFLAGLNVENRYLSKNVKETTSLSGDAKGSAEHDAVLTAQLRHRAYALSRYALYRHSLYPLPLTVFLDAPSIFEVPTDKMMTDLCIKCFSALKFSRQTR